MISSSRSRITGSERLRDGFYLLRLEAPEIAQGCGPGQFVLLRGLGADWPYLRRPFSIYSSNGMGEIEIVYKVVGRATSIMSKSTDGEYGIVGPLGNGFALGDSSARTIALAGGAGVPPLVFYCRTYAGVFEHLTLVVGARTSQELLVPVGLAAEGVEMRPYTEDGSKGTKGTVVDGLVKWLGESAGHKPPEAWTQAVRPRHAVQVVACGPREMLAQVAAICGEAGIPCQVSVEEMMACGLGACLSCAVPRAGGGYRYACKDGPVFDSNSIDWKRWVAK